MQLLISAFACLPNYGSEPGNGWNWSVNLAEAGHTVYVLTRSQNRERIESFLQDHPLANVHFLYLEVPFSRLLGGQYSGPHYLAWQLLAVSRVRKLIRTVKIDLIHHISYGSIHVPSLLWRLKLPIVIGPIGGGQTTPDSMIEYFGKDKFKERLRTALTHALPFLLFHRYCYGKMSAILATNRETLELFRLLGRPDAQLLFDAAIPESFLSPEPRTFSASEEPLRLLWIGRILPRKALPLTLDILAKVNAPFTLTIIGDGPDAPAIHEMLQARGLSERVFWKPGRIPWSEVREAYIRHDAMLFTSLRDSCAHQLLEALAVGLPVITLRIHGGQDLVPDEAGFKIPVHSREQVVHDTAAAVTAFAAMSPMARSRMSEVGWSFARTQTWEHRVAFAAEIYTYALSKI